VGQKSDVSAEKSPGGDPSGETSTSAKATDVTGGTTGAVSDQHDTNTQTEAQRSTESSAPAAQDERTDRPSPTASAKATSDDVAGAATDTSEQDRPPHDSGDEAGPAETATEQSFGDDAGTAQPDNAPEPKPGPNLTTYASGLRRMTQKTSMEKFAKKFWPDNGGWPHPDPEVYRKAKAIYNAVGSHVLEKKIDAKALDEMLKEILSS
jgi:hypothetical protein